MSVRDLILEVLSGLLARPIRFLLSTAGTVLGIMALVSTVGLSQSAGNQIVERLDQLTATAVTAVPASIGGRRAINLPWDAESRLGRLNGVVAVGAFGDVDVGSNTVRSLPPLSGRGTRGEHQMRIVASTPGLLGAIRGSISSGRYFDQGFSDRAARVAVLGAGAAKRLNIRLVDAQPAIFIGDQIFTVIGIMESVDRQNDLLNAVVIPVGTANQHFSAVAAQNVVIETELGAAQLIAQQAAVALNPNDPTLIRVTAPPDPRRLQEAVQRDVNSLFIILGVVSLVIGAIGIANITLLSVLERIGEIGLRRAMGATRMHIALHFLLESTVLGLVGGVLGASLGLFIVAGVSIVRGWTPVLDPVIPIVALFIGAGVGLVAGSYPSYRAASLEPVSALRSGV